jgi:hypothetical protein
LPNESEFEESELKLKEMFSNFEQFLLGIYSKCLENGDTLESLDNMDFLYYLDILVYRKLKNEINSKGEYIDNIML